jgi:hypothetical protein
MRRSRRFGLVVSCLLLAVAVRLQAAPAQGSVSGLVFHDLNGNGSQDAGEPGLVGWTVTATEGADVRSGTTDGTGHFTITNVPSGTREVRVVPPLGWMQTTPDPPGILVGTSGDSPAGSFGFDEVPNVPALGGLGGALLGLSLLAGAAMVLRRSR